MNFVETLQKLEPAFIEAAKLAYAMQQTARSYNKTETGNPAGDIVTEADLAVQEKILVEMSKTDLTQCRLLAEEDTETVHKFNQTENYYLSVDPIDDTAIYARGGEHFSTIVTLHDGKNILYTFVHFPAWNWTHTVVNNSYEAAGKTPNFSLSPGADNTVVYWSGNPLENLPKEVLQDLESKNINFQPIANIGTNIGSVGTFAANQIAGVYHENPNVFDGLTELSIALARNQKVYFGGPSGIIDLTDIREGKTTLQYSGYYMALNEVLSS